MHVDMPQNNVRNLVKMGFSPGLPMFYLAIAPPGMAGCFKSFRPRVAPARNVMRSSIIITCAIVVDHVCVVMVRELLKWQFYATMLRIVVYSCNLCIAPFVAL